MSSPTILVTGAGGFVGGFVAEALHLAGWGKVKAGVTRRSSAARIARYPIDIVECDVLNAHSLDEAVRGVEVVVHCARAKGNDNSVTLDGTRLLLDRIKVAGVKHLIFTSSVAVYGDAVGAVHEGTPPTGRLGKYGAGKIEAEALCKTRADQTLRISVLRPTLVYGPFSELWTLPYIHRFASGQWRRLGPRGEGKCNLIYVGDLVRFIQFLIENDTGDYAVFNANGPEIPTWNEYLEKFNDGLGFPPLGAPNPLFPAQVVMQLPMRALRKFFFNGHRDLISRHEILRRIAEKADEQAKLTPNLDEMRRYAQDVIYSMDAARNAGFVPTTSVDQGIALTVDWAKSVGLVARRTE